MKHQYTDLDQLFEAARQESPQAGFQETWERFSGDLDAGAISGSGIWPKLPILPAGLGLLATAIVMYAPLLNSSPQPEAKVGVPSAIENVQPDQAAGKSAAVKTAWPEPAERPAAKVQPGNQAPKSLPTHAPASPPAELKNKPAATKRLPSWQQQLPRLAQTTAPKHLEEVRFTINERTSTNKLAAIAQQARKAGIDYFYVVDLKKKTIREFNADMTIIGTPANSNVQVSVPKNGPFEITFGWWMDETGKAVRLSEKVIIAEAETKHPLQATAARTLYHSYLNHGLDELERQLTELSGSFRQKNAKERILNTTGYLFMNEQAYAEAIEIFQLNTRLHPGKANPWDSLGEAYFEHGAPEKALAAFQKALSIDPKLHSSRSWIERIRSGQ